MIDDDDDDDDDVVIVVIRLMIGVIGVIDDLVDKVAFKSVKIPPVK
jgi:hypothetical protein